MQQLQYILPAIVLILGILLAYGSYRRHVQHPVVSQAFVTWITFLILLSAIILGTELTALEALAVIALMAIASGFYFFFIRPRIYGSGK